MLVEIKHPFLQQFLYFSHSKAVIASELLKNNYDDRLIVLSCAAEPYDKHI